MITNLKMVHGYQKRVIKYKKGVMVKKWVSNLLKIENMTNFLEEKYDVEVSKQKLD